MRARVSAILLAVVAAWLGSVETMGQARSEEAKTADRLYVLNCGNIHLPDQSRFLSPGVNVGKPVDLLDTCYLIRTANGYFLWETGLTDALVGQPRPTAQAPVMPHKTTSLVAELARVGVTPADIRFVAISHTHTDHAGNVDLFPNATLLMQKAEYDSAFAPTRKPPFSADRPIEKVEGDRDVFGDGSVTLIATPGHTPGHQSLLVHLRRTGWVILTGDAVQMLESWKNQWMPGEDKEGMRTTLRRIAELQTRHNAQIWPSHDPLQADQQRKEREYFD